LAEGRVRWAFWAPDTNPSTLSETGDGIWIQGEDAAGVDSESDGEEEEEEQDRVSESDEGGGEGDDLSDEEDEDEGTSLGGRFGALALEDAGAESTEEE